MNLHDNLNITELSLSGLNLTEIPKGILKYKKLKKLYISNNKITRLENLPENLEELFSNNNQINKIENLPESLLLLYIGHNKISVLENIPKNLQYVYINGNPIETYIYYGNSFMITDIIEEYNLKMNIKQRVKNYLTKFD